MDAPLQMEASISAVEKILNYKFKNKRLVQEALTHPSFTTSASYERLEFLGDAILELAFSKYLYLEYPQATEGQLTELRAVNVSGERLARVAIKHGLYDFLRKGSCAALDVKVRDFADAVSQEDDLVLHGGSVKAPKVLCNIVESLAAAVCLDVNYNLQKFWKKFRGLLEPIITLDDLQKQPHPITRLFELCKKQGKEAVIEPLREGSEDMMMASVYIDGEFIASAYSEESEFARLNAAKEALLKLSALSMSVDVDNMSEAVDRIKNQTFEIEGAKQKLCVKKKWRPPTYRTEKEEGPEHEKKFVCSVDIATVDGQLYMIGEEKNNPKVAQSSAALSLLRFLQKPKKIVKLLPRSLLLMCLIICIEFCFFEPI